MSTKKARHGKPTRPDEFEPVHMALDHKGDLVAVMTSEKNVAYYENMSPNFGTPSIYRDVSPLVAVQYMAGTPALPFLRDDDAWDRVAPALQHFFEHMRAYEEHRPYDPLYKQVPTDFPPHLAHSRLKLMEKYPNIQDIPAMIELTEIYIASEQNRPVNEALFRPESLEPGCSWASLEQVPDQELYARLKMLEKTQAFPDTQIDKRSKDRYAEELYAIESILEGRDLNPTDNPSMSN